MTKFVWVAKDKHPEADKIERIWDVFTDDDQPLGQKIRWKTPPIQTPKEDSLIEILKRIEVKLDALTP